MPNRSRSAFIRDKFVDIICDEGNVKKNTTCIHIVVSCWDRMQALMAAKDPVIIVDDVKNMKGSD